VCSAKVSILFFELALIIFHFFLDTWWVSWEKKKENLEYVFMPSKALAHGLYLAQFFAL
jgi:hypothetical protein